MAEQTPHSDRAKGGVSEIARLNDWLREHIQTLGGAPNTHPLGETYYTQVPLRHSGYIAKISIAPVSPHLVELTGSKVDTSDRPDALREDIAEVLIEQDSVWELRAQLCTDLDKMPIEDSSVV